MLPAPALRRPRSRRPRHEGEGEGEQVVTRRTSFAVVGRDGAGPVTAPCNGGGRRGTEPGRGGFLSLSQIVRERGVFRSPKPANHSTPAGLGSRGRCPRPLDRACSLFLQAEEAARGRRRLGPVDEGALGGAERNGLDFGARVVTIAIAGAGSALAEPLGNNPNGGPATSIVGARWAPSMRLSMCGGGARARLSPPLVPLSVPPGRHACALGSGDRLRRPEGVGPFAALLVASLHRRRALRPSPGNRAGTRRIHRVLGPDLRSSATRSTTTSATGSGSWPVYLLYVIAWLVGGYVRTRRLYLDELRHRAERARAERARWSGSAPREQMSAARIARELHDAVAHSMTVMVMQAEAADEIFATWIPKPPAARSGGCRLTGLEGLCRDAAAASGPPASLGRPVRGLGFNPAWRSLPDSRRPSVRNTGLEVDVTIEGTPRLAPGRHRHLRLPLSCKRRSRT